jgi:hypothetical protein
MLRTSPMNPNRKLRRVQYLIGTAILNVHRPRDVSQSRSKRARNLHKAINQETPGSQLASIARVMRVHLLLRAASEGKINGSGNNMSTRDQKRLSTQPSLGITVRLGKADWRTF